MASQSFKSVYLADYTERSRKSHNLVLAFGERQQDIYKAVAGASSRTMQDLLEAPSYEVIQERADQEGLSVNAYCLWYLRKRLGSSGRTFDHQTSPRPLGDFENRIVEGDCLEVMREIPARSMDMILCDLPYGTTQNKWDSLIPLAPLWNNYERVIKDNGVIALTSQGMFTAVVMMSNPRLFKYKIVWIKSKPTNFLNAKKQPLRKHEDICIFYRAQPVFFPQMSPGAPYNKGFRKDQFTGSYGEFRTVEVKSNGERYPTDVVYFKTAESEGPVLHPTQKPVQLGRYLIRTYTRPGAIVLDNACGSGSFLVAAALEGRRFVGIEKDEDSLLHRRKKVSYVGIASKRVAAAMEEFRRAGATLF